MRHYGFAIATASVVALGGLSAGRAEAAPIGAPGGMRTALNALSITEKAQVYVYLGRTYCWYDSGWNGPGWYWCGYAWRQGLGWGGAYGWHGWYSNSWN